MMKRTCTTLGLLIGATVAVTAQTSPQTPDAIFNATRLRLGRFEYRMMEGGKQIATFTITIEKQADGNFRFAAKGFNQEWESMASSSFAPFSAAL